jgi:hypothetical protein
LDGLVEVAVESVINWIFDNLHWIFSGVGAVIVGVLITKRIKQRSQRQSSGRSSTNIQAGRDVNLGDRDRHDVPDPKKRR